MPTLKAAFLAEIEYKVNPDWVQPADGQPDNSLTMSFTVSSIRGETRSDRQVAVEVKISQSSPEIQPPQTGRLVAVTLLSQIDENLTDRQADEFAVNIGAPIAYGLIRDHLHNLTGSGPYNRMLLPIVPRQGLMQAVTYLDAAGAPLPVATQP
ncbi:hypothetical protein [Nevskia ramosa]|uniref:hypothetical protein n=1 Tax=Nevskia ramosa TaxID=64002 RepID=UPI00235278DA|nr:hypothetical protein [Nevskia ramosa]